MLPEGSAHRKDPLSPEGFTHPRARLIGAGSCNKKHG
jgi:hypothetical protein